MAIQKIVGSDKLKTGFYVKYNDTVDEIISANGSVNSSGVLEFPLFGGGSRTANLGDRFYTKQEINDIMSGVLFGATQTTAGIVRLATENEAITLENGSAAITPATLGAVLDNLFQDNRYFVVVDQPIADFNEAAITGLYKIDNLSTLANRPTAATGDDGLLWSYVNDDRGLQRYLDVSTGIYYERINTNDAWGAWKEVAEGIDTRTYIASENIQVGKLINIHTVGGQLRVRLANNSSVETLANGVALNAATTGGTVRLSPFGRYSGLQEVVAGHYSLLHYNPAHYSTTEIVSNIVPGAWYYLSNYQGNITNEAPTGIVQPVGWGVSPTEIIILPQHPLEQGLIPEWVKAITEEDIELWDAPETDPTVPTWVKNITEEEKAIWSAPETDPTVPSWVKAILSTQPTNWDTAFGWGNHAAANYVTQAALALKPYDSLTSNDIDSFFEAYDRAIFSTGVANPSPDVDRLIITTLDQTQYTADFFKTPPTSGIATRIGFINPNATGGIWTGNNVLNIQQPDGTILTLRNVNEPTAVEPTVTVNTGSALSYVYPIANIQAGSGSIVSTTLISWPSWMNRPTITTSGIVVSAASGDIPSTTGRQYPVVFRVVNSEGQSRTFNIVFQVGGFTPPTVLNPIPNQSATVGTFFTYQIPSNTFSPPSGAEIQTVSAAIPSNAGWLSYNASTRTFTGTPPSSGTISIIVTAIDTNGSTVSDTFDITVAAVSNTNPVQLNVSSLTNVNLQDDGTIGQHILENMISCWQFTNAETGDYIIRVTYNWGGGELSYNLNSTGWLSLGLLDVGPATNGEISFEITLSTTALQTICFRGDGSLSSFYNIVGVTAQKIGVSGNQPPVLVNQPAPPLGTVGVVYNYLLPTVIFSDPDGIIVSEVYSGLPTGLQVLNGRIQGTPTTAGTSIVTLVVTDEDGATAQTQFQIVIINPSVTPTGSLEIIATFA